MIMDERPHTSADGRAKVKQKKSTIFRSAGKSEKSVQNGQDASII